MRAARVLLALVLTAACAKKDATETSVPDDVAFAAITTVDQSGAVLETTPILAWSPGRVLPVFAASEERVLISGWTEAQLAREGGGPIAGATLLNADGADCAPRMPEPRWLGEVSEVGSVRGLPTNEAPRLTSPSLSFCPSEPRLEASFSCSPGCAPRVSPLGACRFDLNFGACGLGHATAIVLPGGETCIGEAQAGDWRCEPLAPSGIYGAAECTTPQGSCAVSVGVVPDEPPFVLEEISIFDVAPFVPERTREFGAIDPRALKAGYAYDMIVYERELLVSTTATIPEETCNGQSDRPGTLYRIDLETMGAIGSSSVPPCLSEMRGDPEGPGFLATFIGASGFHIGRFLRDGTLLDSEALIPSDALEIDRLRTQVVTIVILGPQIFVLLGGRMGAPDRVHVFDQVTLAPLFDRELPPLELTQAIELDSQTILLGGSDPSGLSWFDVGSGTIDQEIPIDIDRFSREQGIYGLTTVNGVITVLASPPKLLLVADEAGNAMAPIPIQVGVPQRFTAWPIGDDRGRLLFATRFGASAGEIDLVATRFDAIDNRISPGTWRIGYGVASTLGADAKHRLYVLLPWAGKIARLTPR